MAKKAYIGVDGKARKIKKGYIGVENFVPRALPSGYTQVSYIQSSGTQYVDTGFKPSWNSRVVVDVSDISSSNAMIFGCRNTASTTAAQQFNIYRRDTGVVRSDYFGTNASLSVADTTGRAVIDKNGNVVTMYGNTVTNTAVSSGTVSYNMFLFAVNNVGTANSHASYKLYSCQIYDNGTLVRDYVPCINPGGTAGLYDMVNAKFYTNAGSGAFTVGSSALSVARKIKKAYIGIGGVARPCWSGGELEYYGTIEPLLDGRAYMAATTVGDYAVFGGGMRPSDLTGTGLVEVYNSGLVRSLPSAYLSVARGYLAATTVGNYALFGGGHGSRQYQTTVDAYSSSLVKSTPTAFSTPRGWATATTVGNYAYFLCGRSTDTNCLNSADYYDGSLTHSFWTSLTNWGKYDLASTTVGNCAIFGGGYIKANNAPDNEVKTIDSSFTVKKADNLSVARYQHVATTVGNYALFGGGFYSTYSAVVDAYNSSLTRSVVTPLSVARIRAAATTLGNYALFGGGESANDFVSTVDVYDESLTRTTAHDMSEIKYYHEAITVGKYALFGGGLSTSGYSAVVDAYTIA